MSSKHPILKKHTRKEIAEKLGVSHQTVINWFNDNHASSMPVRHLEALGFGIHCKNKLGMTIEDLLAEGDDAQ